jgi:general secretion pathway protein C
MVSNTGSNWTVRIATFVVWAAAAASAAYWGLKLVSGNASAPPIAAPLRAAPVADAGAVARLLGHNASSTPSPSVAQPTLASRFSLVGVVAGASQRGAALLVVDGRPAKPYRVGSQVDADLVLQAVEPRRAVLAASADGPPVLTLELPTQQR